MGSKLSRIGISSFGAAIALLLVPASALGAAEEAKPIKAIPARDVSFRNEVEHAVDRGLEWLEKNQSTNGYWAPPETPAVTALALMAFKGEPGGRFHQTEPSWLRKGYAFLLSCARADGGIYRTNLPNYNTSI